MSLPSSKPQFGDRVRVVPTPGSTIRHEVTGVVLPPEGAPATYTSFWARRVAERSVVVTSATGELAPNTATATPIVTTISTPKS
jgi:hypothetical protein